MRRKRGSKHAHIWCTYRDSLLQSDRKFKIFARKTPRPKGNYGVLVSMINQTDGHSWPGLIKPHCSGAIELACSAVE